MQIERTSYFYAAHRNEHLHGDKCFSLHGHTYYVTACVNVGEPKEDGVTILFSDIEHCLAQITDKLDHSVLCNLNDLALVRAMNVLIAQDNVQHKIVYFEQPTSAEYLAQWIYEELVKQDLNVEWIRLRETQSSTIVYRKTDYGKLQSQ